MTDIGEAVAVAAVKKEKDEPCWYCEEESGPNLVNDEAANPETSDEEDEEGVPENDESNESSKLGGNLGSKPDWAIECPDTGASTNALAAAHHCIPGNASLKKAMDSGLVNLMKKGGKLNLSSDIGYSVNHKNNGVWLPGNYAVRGGKEHYTKNWGSFGATFKNKYAKKAMDKSGCQFHDAHPKYSTKVKTTLDNIKNKIPRPKDKCPICNKKFDKTRPPYGLVGRLDFVSGEHRGIINNVKRSDAKSLVTSGYYTSSRVKSYYGII